MGKNKKRAERGELRTGECGEWEDNVALPICGFWRRLVRREGSSGGGPLVFYRDEQYAAKEETKEFLRLL